MELSNLVLVAMVTALAQQQKLLQVLFRSLHPSSRYQLGFNDTWIIYNYVIKMPPLHPRTSTSNSKLRNLNKDHCSLSYSANVLFHSTMSSSVNSLEEYIDIKSVPIQHFHTTCWIVWQGFNWPFPNSILKLRPRLISHQRASNKGVKSLNRWLQS